MDVIEEMDRSKRRAITRDELLEVAHQNNHIAMIKDDSQGYRRGILSAAVPTAASTKAG
ncbi:MAG TPA: hypothetical protein VGX21_18440 [Methylomirabilota bacterium]|nr:hypothetical protein [Methylomirabilota bacterium]